MKFVDLEGLLRFKEKTFEAMSEVESSLATLIIEANQAISALSDRVTDDVRDVNLQLETMRTDTNQQLDSLRTRVTALEASIEEVHSFVQETLAANNIWTMEQITATNTHLTESLEAMDAKINSVEADIRAGLSSVSGRVYTIEDQLAFTIEPDLRDHDRRLKALEAK